MCGEDVPCYFIDALLQRAWMQNGDAEAPLLGVRALMNRAVQLPERAALDVWAPHKHFEVACWDTSAATGGQFIPLELDSADSYPGVEKAGCRVRAWKGSDRQGRITTHPTEPVLVVLMPPAGLALLLRPEFCGLGAHPLLSPGTQMKHIVDTESWRKLVVAGRRAAREHSPQLRAEHRKALRAVDTVHISADGQGRPLVGLEEVPSDRRTTGVLGMDDQDDTLELALEQLVADT